MSQEENPVKHRQAIQQKIMDLLALRDHSENELRAKLALKFSDFPDFKDLLEEALELARNKNWIKPPEELSSVYAETLHRRHKGILYINNQLQEKGLPPIPVDRDLELEKALGVVNSKFNADDIQSRQDKARIGRLLTSRGFDSETVRKVLYEKL